MQILPSYKVVQSQMMNDADLEFHLQILLTGDCINALYINIYFEYMFTDCSNNCASVVSFD